MKGKISRVVDRNRSRWLKLLGRVPDRQLARQAGVSYEVVSRERIRRGIPPALPRPRVKWTRGNIALLGTASDRKIAAQLGISASSVTVKRRALGIPPAGRSFDRPSSFWTPSRLALLGTAPDTEVGRRLGASVHVVAYRRRRNGIPPFRPRPQRPHWTPEMRRLLGRISDRELAERFGLTTGSVRAERLRRGIPAVTGDRRKIHRNRALARLLHRPTPELLAAGISKSTVGKLRKELGVAPPKARSAWNPLALAALGKKPDAQIAAELGLKASTVAAKRQKLGIHRSRKWTAAEEALLGTAPDAVIAQRLNRTRAAVQYHRLLAKQRRMKLAGRGQGQPGKKPPAASSRRRAK